MLAERIRMLTSLHWLGLYATVIAAWSVLFFASAPEELREVGRIFGSDYWAALCTLSVSPAGYTTALAMWALMLVAMMLPTALPAFATYDDLGHAGHQVQLGALAAGYMIVWLGFSALAAAVQIGLLHTGLVSPFGDSRSLGLSALLLTLAGAYQFTPMKAACLTQCRAPLTFFLRHSDEGPWRNGLRLGLVCIGCCWALMLLALVGGTMNLAFMGLATLLMTLEKLPDIGRWVSGPLGLALLVAAGWVSVGLI